MAQRDKQEGKGISRRDFVKASAAVAGAGAVGVGVDLTLTPSKAAAAGVPVAATYHTTCPYCSASCGQFIDVDASGNVLDIYGDHRSPFNDGGLCAKGAGTYQLVTNKRRIGAWAGAHPVNNTFAYDAAFTDGIAYKRTGNGAWGKMDLQDALDEISGKLVTARGALSDTNGYNSKGVAFMGSSHMNNEQNMTYRRLIAQFGTSNVEHQARI